MEDSREEISEDHLSEGMSGKSRKDETLGGEGDTSRRIWKLKLNRTGILMTKGKIWFLWLCLALDVVPRTLQTANKDPKASNKDEYMEEMKMEWEEVKKETGRRFVKLTMQREEKNVRTRSCYKGQDYWTHCYGSIGEGLRKCEGRYKGMRV